MGVSKLSHRQRGRGEQSYALRGLEGPLGKGRKVVRAVWLGIDLKWILVSIDSALHGHSTRQGPVNG